MNFLTDTIYEIRTVNFEELYIYIYTQGIIDVGTLRLPVTYKGSLTTAQCKQTKNTQKTSNTIEGDHAFSLIYLI